VFISQTERYFDVINFSVEYMALADCCHLKYDSRSRSSWSPLSHMILLRATSLNSSVSVTGLGLWHFVTEYKKGPRSKRKSMTCMV
jgi:hypothetical protein